MVVYSQRLCMRRKNKLIYQSFLDCGFVTSFQALSIASLCLFRLILDIFSSLFFFRSFQCELSQERGSDFNEARKHPFQYEVKFSSIHLPFQNFKSKMAIKMTGCFISEDAFEAFNDIYGPLLRRHGWREEVCYQKTEMDTFSNTCSVVVLGQSVSVLFIIN